MGKRGTKLLGDFLSHFSICLNQCTPFSTAIAYSNFCFLFIKHHSMFLLLKTLLWYTLNMMVYLYTNRKHRCKNRLQVLDFFITTTTTIKNKNNHYEIKLLSTVALLIKKAKWLQLKRYTFYTKNLKNKARRRKECFTGRRQCYVRLIDWKKKAIRLHLILQLFIFIFYFTN